MTTLSGLTPVQQSLLKRFATGAVMHRVSHSRLADGESYFFQMGDKGIHCTTVWKLLKLGLIEDIGDPAWRWRGSKYRITQTGREIARND
jgi:hypothetical protein